MNYRNIAITQKGLALHSKCTLRQGGIEFTRFATGDFRHEEGLDLTLLTGLTNEKQSFPFSNITRYSENEILLSVVITNVGLKESYYINEIGIFANDTDEGEILYAVTVPDNPDVDIDYMSAYDEESPNPHTIYFDQYLKASNTADCTITVDEKSHASLKEFLEHINNKENPHCTRREQLAIENVDNTSDMEKPVSRAQQDALDAQYRQLTSYTDTEIADLIDGAPQTLDTLREIAEAMTDNKDVVEALQEAVGSKASKAEFDSHESNYHNPHRVEAEDVGLGNVPNVSTNDQTPTYTPVTLPTVLTSGEKLSAAFGKLAGAVADYITHKADMIKRMTAVEAGVSSLNKNLIEQIPYKRVLYDKAATLSATADNIFNCTDSVASYDFIILEFTLSYGGMCFQQVVSYTSQNFYIVFDNGAIKKRIQWVFSTNLKEIVLHVIENSGAYDIIFRKATGYRIPVSK